MPHLGLNVYIIIGVVRVNVVVSLSPGEQSPSERLKRSRSGTNANVADDDNPDSKIMRDALW